jgi:hypothetical protein
LKGLWTNIRQKSIKKKEISNHSSIEASFAQFKIRQRSKWKGNRLFTVRKSNRNA